MCFPLHLLDLRPYLLALLGQIIDVIFHFHSGLLQLRSHCIQLALDRFDFLAEDLVFGLLLIYFVLADSAYVSQVLDLLLVINHFAAVGLLVLKQLLVLRRNRLQLVTLPAQYLLHEHSEGVRVVEGKPTAWRNFPCN